MGATIAVTGATGNIGNALARSLLRRGARVRVLGRSAERLAPLAREGAEPFAGDLEDAAFLERAFRGADAAWLMIPPNYGAADPRDYQHRAAESMARAVSASGVRRVALLSSLGADLPGGTGPVAGLHDFESRFRDVPEVGAIVLRPGLFMENHLAALGAIRASGAVASTVRPDVPVPLIATRDVAEAAASVLESPSFGGWTVRALLGPRDVTGVEAARVLGEAARGSPFACVQVVPAEYRKGLLAAGCSPAFADDLLELETALDSGRIQRTVRRTPESTTPTSLDRFARDTFAPAWNAA